MKLSLSQKFSMAPIAIHSYRDFGTRLSLGVLLCCASVLAGAEDISSEPPNLRLEQKLDRVYKSYNSTPTDDMLWETAVKNSNAQNYAIQPKDSLWEISEVVFGDPNFWPKLWSLNKSIFNPHEISIGATLSFISNVEQPHEAPVLEVVNNKPDTEKLPEVSPEVLALTSNITLPESTREIKPLARGLPAVTPQWKFSKGPKSVRLDLTRPPRDFETLTKVLPFYVADDSPTSKGEITGVEADLSEAGYNNYVYVKIEGGAKTKQIFTVIHEKEPLSGDDTLSEGHVVEVFGEIEVQEAVHPQESIYRALVTKSIHLMAKGSQLISGPMPNLSVGSDGPSPKLQASVIAGIYGDGEHMYGVDQFVVLNRGKAGGLAEGQVFPIFQRHIGKPAEEFEKVNPRKIGQIRIVRVATNFATALVLNQADAISTGDSIGTAEPSVPAPAKEIRTSDTEDPEHQFD